MESLYPFLLCPIGPAANLGDREFFVAALPD